MKLLLAPLLLLAPPPSSPAPGLDETTRDVLREMHVLVEPCVQPTTGKRVFTRCFDTHSSIHAHWAAYRIARVLPDRDAAALASEQALEYAKLRHEVPFMGYRYARAWFLRLAIDYEAWCEERGRPDPRRLRPIAALAARFLADDFTQNPPDPWSVDYNNAAWALGQLHAWAAFVGDDALRDQAAAWIDSIFVVDIEGTGLRDDLNSSRFFSTYGNWVWVVLSTRPAAEGAAFLDLQDPVQDAHLAVNETDGMFSAPHAFGLTWSRAWALARMATLAPDPEDAERYARALREHVRVGMLRHADEKDKFGDYGHWVPQFAVYAVTEGLVPE